MAKKSLYIFVLLFCLMISTLPISLKVEAAATTFKGTFVNVSYSETQLKDGTVEKKLSTITLENSSGKTTTLNIDDYADLYINNTLTTIQGFKRGMQVEATVNLRKVTTLHGTSKVEEGVIVPKSKQKSGIVTKIDPNGMFIWVKLDQENETTYYVNRNTHFVKGHDTVDISSLYEGDRVHLKFSNTTTSVLAEVEIAVEGVLIENLYKANFQTVNTSANKITVQNAQPFENWVFWRSNNTRLSTYSFTNNTPIYVGDKKVSKNELKNYRTSDVYFVTVEQFGKELIQKIIVLENYERTYYEPITSVNASAKFIHLKDKGRVNFHEGTILVRHGRLVEPTSLVAYGSAYVITDGGTKDNFAHIINIVNDGFMKSDLETQNLYFGELSLIEGYEATFTNLYNLQDHVWIKEKNTKFSFSNSTNVKENFRDDTLRVIANRNLKSKLSQRGYFYVKDGHIQAIHFIQSTEDMAQTVSAGTIQRVDTANETVTVRNTSHWISGEWGYMGSMINVSIRKALIIRDGKVIEPEDLKINDRVVLVRKNGTDGHVLIVNKE